MSHIRERGGKWQARVTVNGNSVARTFTTRTDAEKWARHQRVSMERGDWQPPSSTTTMADTIGRYEREVLPLKRGRDQEKYILGYWKRSSLARQPLSAIKPADIARERDKRLQELSSGSVRRYLDVLSGVFSVAVRDWQYVAANPVKAIRKPPNGRARERRLMPGELDRISDATESPDLPTIITIAIETGMRRSEILGLEWRRVDLQKRLAFLELTKNGESRTVPLSMKAAEVLAQLPRRIDGYVFKKNGTSVSGAFQRAVTRARRRYEIERAAAGVSAREIEQDPYLQNIRLHDLRHECVSRLVESGFNLIEAAAVSGHKTMSCLRRYAHMKPAHLVAKLDAMVTG